MPGAGDRPLQGTRSLTISFSRAASRTTVTSCTRNDASSPSPDECALMRKNSSDTSVDHRCQPVVGRDTEQRLKGKGDTQCSTDRQRQLASGTAMHASRRAQQCRRRWRRASPAGSPGDGGPSHSPVTMPSSPDQGHEQGQNRQRKAPATAQRSARRPATTSPISSRKKEEARQRDRRTGDRRRYPCGPAIQPMGSPPTKKQDALSGKHFMQNASPWRVTIPAPRANERQSPAPEIRAGPETPPCSPRQIRRAPSRCIARNGEGDDAPADPVGGNGGGITARKNGRCGANAKRCQRDDPRQHRQRWPPAR